eukprot:5047264-Karenia_brevis.AAC.1
MVAIVQQLPGRKLAQGKHLTVVRPTTRDHLEAKGHILRNRDPGCVAICVARNGQKGKQGVGAHRA